MKQQEDDKMADSSKIYPRTGDAQTVYLKNVITQPNIEAGDYTMYNDFIHDPAEFEQNNVFYQYPINQDRLLTRKPLPGCSGFNGGIGRKKKSKKISGRSKPAAWIN